MPADTISQYKSQYESYHQQPLCSSDDLSNSGSSKGCIPSVLERKCYVPITVSFSNLVRFHWNLGILLACPASLLLRASINSYSNILWDPLFNTIQRSLYRHCCFLLPVHPPQLPSILLSCILRRRSILSRFLLIVFIRVNRVDW
jgi:hypothetical protein